MGWMNKKSHTWFVFCVVTIVCLLKYRFKETRFANEKAFLLVKLHSEDITESNGFTFFTSILYSHQKPPRSLLLISHGSSRKLLHAGRSFRSNSFCTQRYYVYEYYCNDIFDPNSEYQLSIGGGEALLCIGENEVAGFKKMSKSEEMKID